MNPVPDPYTPGAQRTIVVGVDHSVGARRALEHATNRAGPAGRLLVAHVIAPISDTLGRGVHEFRRERREVAQEFVDELVADITVDHEARVLVGDTAERLADLAREAGADEIVVGSRGFGPLRGVLGSVSHAVLHETDRVVVVIPDDAVTAR